MKSLWIVLAAAVATACELDVYDAAEPRSGEEKQVIIFIGEGYNDLASDISRNLKTIPALPMAGNSSVLITICHYTAEAGDYKTPTSPFVGRLHSDWSGSQVTDTLKLLKSGSRLTDTEVLREALTFVKDLYPSARYGVVMSSHGTGWLPETYYSKPTARKGEPRTKTFGCEAGYVGGSLYSYEMEISELAESFPMKVDWIVFDSCLMGCVEVAWELKDVTSHIGFSQTEVLSSGFNFKTFSSRLLSSHPADPRGWCADYFDLYNSSSGNRAATISYVNCTRLDSLSRVCARLNSSYQIDTLKKAGIQTFMRNTTPWFYDLKDIYEKAGASEPEIASLQSALDLCVEYTAHTPFFLGLKVDKDCGFSMFLPSTGSDALKSFYKTLGWNKATGLLK